MAIEEHLRQLNNGLTAWNTWISQNPHESPDFSGANLSGRTLCGEIFNERVAIYMNLSGANLSGADLSGAEIGRADLRGADLSGANLRGANHDGANLRGANHDGANHDGADLRGAILK